MGQPTHHMGNRGRELHVEEGDVGSQENPVQVGRVLCVTVWVEGRCVGGKECGSVNLDKNKRKNIIKSYSGSSLITL